MLANEDLYCLTPIEGLEELIFIPFTLFFDFFGNFFAREAGKEFLRACPNLKRLEASAIDSILRLVPSKLEILKVIRINQKLEWRVKFKFLKHLFLQTFHEVDTEILITFLNNHSTIEIFGVETFSGSSKIVDTLLSMPNMKHLEFGGKVSSLKDAFEKIIVDSKKLETLQLNFQELPTKPRVLFEFPYDANKWFLKCPFLQNYEEFP